MTKRFILILVCACLAGCAGPKAVTKSYSVENGGKFIGINLGVDAGRYIQANDVKVVEHIYHGFEESGLFQGVETGFPRWPVSIQLKYSKENLGGNAENFAKAMVSASTLLVIPANFEESHIIKARILLGNKVVNSLEYTEKATISLSLFQSPENQIEIRKNAINRILERLFSDLKEKHLIPTELQIDEAMKSNNVQQTL